MIRRFFHSHWLNYKINHGLAPRGYVTPDFRCKPKGFIAGLLYKLYFRRKENEQDENTE